MAGFRQFTPHVGGASLWVPILFVGFATLATLGNKRILMGVLPSSNMLFLYQSVANLAFLLALRIFWPPSSSSSSSTSSSNIDTPQNQRTLMEDHPVTPHEGWMETNPTLDGRRSPDNPVVPTTGHVVYLLKDITTADVVVGIMFTLNVACGLASLKYVSVPVFNTLKRITTFFIWMGEYWLLRTDGALKLMPPILLLVAGAGVTGAFDLSFHGWGYAWALVSGVMHAGSLLLTKYSSRIAPRHSSIQVQSTLLLNSLISMLLLSVIISVKGEWSLLGRVELGTQPLWTLGLITTNTLSVFALNFSVFLNCLVNSPMTHAVVANGKTAVTTILSFVFFNQPLSALAGVGVIINFIGTCWYSLLKYSTQRVKAKAPAEV